MAKIVETATRPLNAVDVDVVTLDLIENALRSARYEMDETLFRTALSPGIREQHDEFPLIADPSGKMIVGQFGLSIPDFLENFSGTIEEGDVLMTSDPYSCGAAISHANDWLVVMPIFFEGRIVGWASQFGHMTDVGGKTPASMPTDARTIFEEGVIIPPSSCIRKGNATTPRWGSSSTRSANRTGTVRTSTASWQHAAQLPAGSRRCARVSAWIPTPRP
ncbi:uncharacterized protein MJ0963 [Arthrobacter sp. Hiyo4]|nr:uncharacterized protein MJ0963 [Arthrobacter sp. Hiyo4]